MKGCSEMAKANGNVDTTTPDTGTEIVRANGTSALDKIAMLSSGSGIMSTVGGNDMAAKKLTLNAVTNAESVDDHLGEEFNLVHCVFQQVTVVDDRTQEANETVRTILLADDGKAFAAISEGLVGSLRDIFGILGMPDSWPEPLPVRVVEKKSRRGYKFFTIELA